MHGADVQDRDGAADLIKRSCKALPTLTKLFADRGDVGQKLEAAVAHIDQLTIEIIRRSDLAGFVILTRRWVIERALAWLIGAGASRRSGSLRCIVRSLDGRLIHQANDARYCQTPIMSRPPSLAFFGAVPREGSFRYT